MVSSGDIDICTKYLFFDVLYYLSLFLDENLSLIIMKFCL
jgi:hypothetical protein